MRNGVARFGVGVAACAAAAWALPAQADAIRVDDQWYQNVYVRETAQFYQVLFPESGETLDISKKRQDVSEPRLSKDEAERTSLRQRWEQAAKERKAVDERDIEVRVRTQHVTNLATGQRPERRKLTPDEIAARQAQWESTLLQRQQFQEEQERLRAERFGTPLPEEPLLEEEPLPEMLEAETPAEETLPPGPRQQPATRPQSAEDVYEEEMLRMQNDPYANSGAAPGLSEQAAQEEYERMQAEAYYWEQMEAQGYLDAMNSGLRPASPLGGGEY